MLVNGLPTYVTLTEQPDLVPFYLARQGARGPNAVRLGEVLDVLLARAGVRGSSVPEARRVLIVHTIGFAAFATAATSTLDATAVGLVTRTCALVAPVAAS